MGALPHEPRPLTENEARCAEVSLMASRLGHMARKDPMTTHERIGVLRAMAVLEDRARALAASHRPEDD